jgi:NAD(P)-dependent dehydrogenase (short-subunit alcohol dehydrogenase family)
MQKIALVTGGNRGIGFMAGKMMAQAGLRVILGSRDLEAGKRAVDELKSEGIDVETCQLEVTDTESIDGAKDYVLDKHGRLDVLVNNAGVDSDIDDNGLDVSIDLVREIFEVNVYGCLRLCQVFIPIMKEHNFGRVINVSSDMGALSQMSAQSVGYRMSKAALNAMTRVLASEVKGYNIKINTMSPGWVRSDMGGPTAPRSLEEGADTIVWLALHPDDGPSGEFFKDRKPLAW